MDRSQNPLRLTSWSPRLSSRPIGIRRISSCGCRSRPSSSLTRPTRGKLHLGVRALLSIGGALEAFVTHPHSAPASQFGSSSLRSLDLRPTVVVVNVNLRYPLINSMSVRASPKRAAYAVTLEHIDRLTNDVSAFLLNSVQLHKDSKLVQARSYCLAACFPPSTEEYQKFEKALLIFLAVAYCTYSSFLPGSRDLIKMQTAKPIPCVSSTGKGPN
jgi:hypothetical protein